MKWNEIVQEADLVEGTNFHCPVCDEDLGKESELDLNDSWYCGNCGWSAKTSKEPARQEYDPFRAGGSSDAPAGKPAPAPKPTPKSKQTIVKQLGDYEARVYPGRNSGGLYYIGQAPDRNNASSCKGEVKKMDDGTYVPTWYASDYHKFKLPAVSSMGAAMNAIKAKHKKLLNNKKPGMKYADF